MNPQQPRRSARSRAASTARVVAAVLCVAAFVSAQTERYDGWDRIRDDSWVHDPDESPALGFVVRGTRGARNALDEALASLADGDAEAAARGFVDIAERYPDHVIQVEGGYGRWVGAGELALYLLETAVPAAAVAGLDDHAQRDAVQEAIAWRDVPALGRLARRWEGQPAGREATLAMARLLAERGDVQAALMAAERGLQLARVDGDDDGAMFAELVSSLRRHAPPAVSLLGVDEPPTDLKASWAQTLTTESLPTLTNGEPDENVFNVRESSNEAPFAPIVPVVRDGIAYVADTVSVSALNVFSGRRIWHHAGPLERATVEPGYGVGSFSYDVYAHSRRTRAISPTQLAQPVVTDHMVIATQQVLEAERPTQMFDNVPINWPLPRRRIVALDRVTGEEVWRQERSVYGPDAFVNTFDVHGPVVVNGGVVYASGSVTQGSINAYVAAFDLATGEELWRTLVCLGQQDLTMFNRAFQEHTTSPPLLHDGSLYVSSNLGVVACVDAWSGRMRWVTGYQQTPRQKSRSHMQNTTRSIYWLNQPPQMGDDAVVVAPLDSQVVLALDPQTGRTLWNPIRAEIRRSMYRHQPIVTSSKDSDVLDRLLMVGSDTVEMFDLDDGKPLRPELFAATRRDSDSITAPAELIGRTLVLPTYPKLLHVDIDSWMVTGETDGPKLRSWRRVRRIVPAGFVTLFTDHHELSGSLDAERVESLLRVEAERSPSARVTLGEVRLGAKSFDDAIASFSAALDMRGVTLDVREQALGGWLQAALGAARERETPAAWNELLEVARDQGRLTSHAREALTALNELNATAVADTWVERLLADVPLTPEHRAEQRAALELLVTLHSPHYDARKATLARLLGEDVFASALEGAHVPAVHALVAPRLPGNGGDVVEFEVEASRLFLPNVTGVADDEYAQLLIGALNSRGRIVALDAAAGGVAWTASMPGGVQSVNASNSDFIFHGDRLVVKSRYALAVLSLEDGSTLWTSSFDGATPLDVVVHSGLVIVLLEDGERDDVFFVTGYGLNTGVRATHLDLAETKSATLMLTGDELLVFQRIARSVSVAPERHMLTLDPVRGRVIHDTRMSTELEVIGDPIHERSSVLFRHSMSGDVRWSSWNAKARAVEWSRDLATGSSVLVSPGGGQLMLMTMVVDRTTGDRHDVPVRVDLETGKEQSAYGSGTWHALMTDSMIPHDALVMLSGDGMTLRVIDGQTVDDRAWIERDERFPSATQLVQGRDGFAVGSVRRSSRDNSKVIDLFVARGEDAGEQYSHTFETRTRSFQPLAMSLVDGALVLVKENRVWMVRDARLADASGDQR